MGLGLHRLGRPGFIEFAAESDRVVGSFQFGTVVGWLDCRRRQVDGSTFIEWSWEGHSDADPGCGRGWATLVNGELVGRLFIHGGDDSAFKAIKRSRPFKPSKPLTKTSGRRVTASRD